MELDFSKLDKLAYRGFEGVEARATRDKMIEQGYTIIEDAETPFKAAEAPQAKTSTPPHTSPAKRKLEPFTGMDTSRNYRAMYRAACDFHERHNPPTVDREYWKSHIPGVDETPQSELDYWAEVTKDINATASTLYQDPFLIGLLMAIFEELEREYREIKGKCGFAEMNS